MFTPPIISKILAVSAFTAFLSLSATSVSAINLIPNVTASTDMGAFGPNYNLQATVNGSGLSGNTPSLTGAHNGLIDSNIWLSSLGVKTGNITFNLGGSYNLSGFSFWNFSSNPPIGIRDVSILTSTDGTNYTSLAGAPTQFAVGVSATSVAPQTFTFSPTTASFVRFTVGSNWGFTGGGGLTGFGEVQFGETAATPVPFDFDPSLGVVGLGVVFGINKWRKNKNKDVKK